MAVMDDEDLSSLVSDCLNLSRRDRAHVDDIHPASSDTPESFSRRQRQTCTYQQVLWSCRSIDLSVGQ